MGFAADGLPVYDSLVAEEPLASATVGIGELAVASDGRDVRSNGFGSCVGVALVDESAGVVGLAHSMLPVDPCDPDVDHPETPARYADTGVRALLADVVAAGGDPDRLVAKLVGGSRMFSFGGAEGTIGDRNVAAARETLATLGVPVVGADVGGTVGRSVVLDAAGNLVVRRAAGDAVTL